MEGAFTVDTATGSPRESETYALCLFSTTGTLVLAGYTVTNLAALAVTTAFPDRRDLDSYPRQGPSPALAGASLVVALLGLVGTPPTVVFAGKLLPPPHGTANLPGWPCWCSSTGIGAGAL